MPPNQNPWIEVYPLNGREIRIVNSGARISLNKELSDHCDNLWKPKAEKGWKSSWIAFAETLRVYSNSQGYQHEMKAGAMLFSQVEGIVKSIEEKKSFAPSIGYSNCLSVGFLTATKDGYIIFQRRAPDVHCPNILIHEPCGYMASMAFAPRAECDSNKYSDDERLFDLKTQLDFRKKAIADTLGVSEELVSYEPNQDLLACGWLTKEMYFSTTGKIDANKKELSIPEKGEFFFIPFEHIKSLISNQGRLSRIDANGYRPLDSREIPLIDESLIGLIYGYKKLTGEKLDIDETIDRLNHDGLEIKVHKHFFNNEFSPKNYKFLTSF